MIKENEINMSRRYLPSYVYCSTTYNRMTWNPPTWPLNEWIKNVVHMQNGLLFSHKMDETGDHYVNWNKQGSEKHINTALSSLFVESKKKKTLIEVERWMVITREPSTGKRLIVSQSWLTWSYLLGRRNCIAQKGDYICLFIF